MASLPLQAQERTIAALGDSLTQGFGLPPEDGFVPQLQRWLDDQGVEVRLINAGVSGDTTAGGLARVAWTLTPEVDGMMVALGGNDMLRGVEPASARANLDGIMLAAEDAGVDVLIVGMSAPSNFGPAYKAEFDAIYPDLAEGYGALLVPGFFDGLSDGAPLTPAAAAPWMQADGIHPNAEGVAKIVAHIGPRVLELIAKIHGQD